MDTDDEQPTAEQPTPTDAEPADARAEDEVPEETDVQEREQQQQQDDTGGRRVHWSSVWMGAGAVAALVASFLAGMAVQAHVDDDSARPGPPMMQRGSFDGGPFGRGFQEMRRDHGAMPERWQGRDRRDDDGPAERDDDR